MIEEHHLRALGVAASYAGYCAAVAWRWRSRHRVPVAGEGGWLVVHASQTGQAEAIARRTAAALRARGEPVRLAPLDALDAPSLAAAPRLLLVVSTAGEGDAPDRALPFLRRVMKEGTDLSATRFGLLALGDRGYVHFCAFGRRLDGWLRECGAEPLFDRIEVDREDGAALSLWREKVAALLPPGGAAVPEEEEPEAGTTRWRLAERRLLNPGEPDHPAYHLALVPDGPLPEWEAGDIATLHPRHPPAAVAAWLAARDLSPTTPVEAAEGATLGEALAHRRLPEDAAPLGGLTAQALLARLPPLPGRDYSIASLPAEGRIELVVRLMRDASGRPGLGSGWLTQHASPESPITLRLRRNPGFHAPEAARPLILVGAGTGLAGLRAHLKARHRAGARRNWLVFGERFATPGQFHRDEIAAWRAEGLLERLDLAFSRGEGGPRYVQDVLRAEAEALRRWIAGGAALYLCGSRAGMGQGVQQALEEVLGAAEVEALLAGGRYRRDIY